MKTNTVRAMLQGHAHLESGADLDFNGDRNAIVAHWAEGPKLSRSVCQLVYELQKSGYMVMLSSASEHREPLQWHPDVEVGPVAVLRRPNVGYDFGSWSMALAEAPELARAEHVLIVNDSMAGPLEELGPLLARMEAMPVDVWGLTDSDQFGPHLQSYFLGFRGGTLAEKPVRKFWEQIRHESSKDDVIRRGELALSVLLNEEGFVTGPAFSWERYVRPGQNPVIQGWSGLLKDGFPFVKRELLRRPDIAPGGHRVFDFVTAMKGIDLMEWVDDRGSQCPN